MNALEVWEQGVSFSCIILHPRLTKKWFMVNDNAHWLCTPSTKCQIWGGYLDGHSWTIQPPPLCNCLLQKFGTMSCKHPWERKVICYQLESKNNLSTFRLQARIILPCLPDSSRFALSSSLNVPVVLPWWQLEHLCWNVGKLIASSCW